MSVQDVAVSPPMASAQGPARRVWDALRRWPLGTRFVSAALVALYAPVVVETGRGWLDDAERYGHSLIVVAISLGILYASRGALSRAPYAPCRWGLPWLTLGLAAETVGWLLNVRFVAMASLIPTVAGAVIAMHGRGAWRIVRFPVCFLLFAATWPGFLLAPISDWIQGVSAVGAGAIAQALQVPLIQNGNVFILPGARLEVADVCSGFKKLIALVAVSVWYGHAYGLHLPGRAALVAVAVPVAVAANVLRIDALIGLALLGGEGAVRAAHNGSELVVLLLAYVLFVAIGRALGCTKLRSYA